MSCQFYISDISQSIHCPMSVSIAPTPSRSSTSLTDNSHSPLYLDLLPLNPCSRNSSPNPIMSLLLQALQWLPATSRIKAKLFSKAFKALEVLPAAFLSASPAPLPSSTPSSVPCQGLSTCCSLCLEGCSLVLSYPLGFNSGVTAQKGPP